MPNHSEFARSHGKHRVTAPDAFKQIHHPDNFFFVTNPAFNQGGRNTEMAYIEAKNTSTHTHERSRRHNRAPSLQGPPRASNGLQSNKTLSPLETAAACLSVCNWLALWARSQTQLIIMSITHIRCLRTMMAMNHLLTLATTTIR
jgi:hypothetical protein